MRYLAVLIVALVAALMAVPASAHDEGHAAPAARSTEFTPVEDYSPRAVETRRAIRRALRRQARQGLGRIKGHPGPHYIDGVRHDLIDEVGGPLAIKADISPSVQYAQDSIRGLTGQAPDNDLGRRITQYWEANYNINVYSWYWGAAPRVNDHHIHLGIHLKWRHGCCGPHGGEVYDVAHAWVDWPHDSSLRRYYDNFGH